VKEDKTTIVPFQIQHKHKQKNKKMEGVKK
jgi:hypothetical protein